MKVFLIHGAYGSPGENWFPWLKKELEMLGCEVVVPRFPTPEGQSLENWLKVFAKQTVGKDDVFVAHSLGPAFVLSLLEKKKCRACFFVAGFVGLLGNETFDAINESFVTKDFDWEAIMKRCKEFVLFHADDDPYVPLAKGRQLAERLGVEPVIVKGAGHFNEKAGYTRFPLLLERIRELL